MNQLSQRISSLLTVDIIISKKISALQYHKPYFEPNHSDYETSGKVQVLEVLQQEVMTGRHVLRLVPHRIQLLHQIIVERPLFHEAQRLFQLLRFI